MRLILATPLLAAFLALSACGTGGSGGPDNNNDFPPNCAEQSALATQGRTDGLDITITCP
jgi:hypothetical protein